MTQAVKKIWLCCFFASFYASARADVYPDLESHLASEAEVYPYFDGRLAQRDEHSLAAQEPVARNLGFPVALIEDRQQFVSFGSEAYHVFISSSRLSDKAIRIHARSENIYGGRYGAELVVFCVNVSGKAGAPFFAPIFLLGPSPYPKAITYIHADGGSHEEEFDDDWNKPLNDIILGLLMDEAYKTPCSSSVNDIEKQPSDLNF